MKREELDPESVVMTISPVAGQGTGVVELTIKHGERPSGSVIVRTLPRDAVLAGFKYDNSPKAHAK